MKYIESTSTNPYFNLALEEYVFDKLPKGDSYFMLWQNANTIVIGKYQNTAEEINQTYVEENNIKVVRRLSGGGAVYHDLGNLNFTFIVDQEEVDDFNFQVFVAPVVNALAKFNVNAQFNGRNDITIDGCKFSGNSQYGRGGRILHHGCIMLESNTLNVASALKVKEAKFLSKNTKSVKSRVTTINEHAPVPITMDQFKVALKDEIFGNNKIDEYVLTPEDFAEIERIQKERYETWEWNYGRIKPYTMERIEKFPSGLVQCKMTVDKGIIQDIQLFGDFFGNSQIAELEAALVGCPLDTTLETRLEKLNVESYMNGISARELARLIKG